VTDLAVLERLRRLAIPPAWVGVWASADESSAVQATGIDSRGRTQYRYAPTATHLAADAKYERMLAFAAALPNLRQHALSDLQRATKGVAPEAPVVIATIIRLIERGLFRVGNERYARDNHTYGLTTMTRGQVDVAGSTMTFEFVGKEHLSHHIVVNDLGAATVVGTLLSLPGDRESRLFITPSGDGFRGLHSSDVNAYLHAHTGAPATAKVFRTWGATTAAAAVMAGAGHPGLKPRMNRESHAVRAASDLLGDTPAVVRTSYLHPGTFEAGRSRRVASAVDAAAADHKTRAVSELFTDERVQSAVLEELVEASEQP